MSVKVYDVCFLGCGASAALHLLHHRDFFRNKSVLILEKGASLPRDKTFCSFSSLLMPNLEVQKWSCFQAKHHDFEATYDTPIPYQYLDSKRLFDSLEAMLQASPQIELKLNTPVLAIDHHAGVFSINQHRAYHVIDSRPIQLPKPHWIQHFYGWEIEFEEESPVREPVMMDIDSSFKEGLKFFYLIPKARNRLLVEVTFFSDRVFEKSFYQREIENYIQSKSWESHRWKAEEYGEIPLVNIVPPRELPPNYCIIGARAGNLRASTGYSVWRSYRHSATAGALPRASQDLKWRVVGLMDEIFLRVLQHQPDCAANLFSRFFKRLPAGAIAEFMSENPTWMSLLRVIWIMPKMLFLSSLARRSRFCNRYQWRLPL